MPNAENALKTDAMAELNARQIKILDHVQQQGFAAIESLADYFDVTPQTIRRDINQLCDKDLLQRFHGGAGMPSSAENVDYSTRQIHNPQEKQSIALIVARMIPDNSSLFINLGTTTEEVAVALENHHGLRVITNNLNVANTLSRFNDCEIIIAGGLLRRRDSGIVGEATIDFINQFKVDFGVIGISGIDHDGTLLDFDYREVRVSQAIIKNSRRVFLVADHSKFGRNAMVKLGHLRDVDAIFTDRNPPKDVLDIIQAEDIGLHVA